MHLESTEKTPKSDLEDYRMPLREKKNMPLKVIAGVEMSKVKGIPGRRINMG